MAERKHTHGLLVSVRNGVTVIGIGDMEIWDGADLSLIRDTLFSLINVEEVRSIGVDLRFVQYVPSGFFGMLYDWYERGIDVTLYHPRLRVRNMLWFRKFFTPSDSGIFQLHDGQRVNEALSEELWVTPEPITADDVISVIVS